MSTQNNDFLSKDYNTIINEIVDKYKYVSIYAYWFFGKRYTNAKWNNDIEELELIRITYNSLIHDVFNDKALSSKLFYDKSGDEIGKENLRNTKMENPKFKTLSDVFNYLL
jgi:hypothetical protein